MRRTWVRVYDVEVEVLYECRLIRIHNCSVICWLLLPPNELLEVEAALEWRGRQMTVVPKVEPAEVQPLQALHP